MYYSNLLSVYIWYDLRNILMCVFYKSLIWLRSLPCASFISRALMCLSTWVCAIGSCFWVFVYCYLIKDRLPCRSTLSEHCKRKQHTVIVADTPRQACTFTSKICLNLHQIVPFKVTMDWDLWMKKVCIANLGVCGHYNAFLSSQQHSVPWKHTFTVSILHEHAL